ncbi:hypothetical protein D779_1665 [Imhoffiella purpurea]|uniref:Uncharacterized protein n=1 Tax=Imhoffiella purpurea TaxID=1249627 RepID=W9VDP2_9GAMM|nr:hypothetical protein D779_1665 [Imhoffiella purpurea]
MNLGEMPGPVPRYRHRTGIRSRNGLAESAIAAIMRGFPR